MATRFRTEEYFHRLVYITSQGKSPRSLVVDLDIPVTDQNTLSRVNNAIEKRALRARVFDNDEPPKRFTVTVNRVVRDSAASRALKSLYDHKCQVCGTSLELTVGQFYSEAHHIRPLGGAHQGTDSHDNMLVLCPNDHALFDYGVPKFIDAQTILIGKRKIVLTLRHSLSEAAIHYHNSEIHDSI